MVIRFWDEVYVVVLLRSMWILTYVVCIRCELLYGREEQERYQTPRSLLP